MFKRSFFKFEFKVIALMLVTLVIVVVTGVAAYFRFSNLLGNISQSVRPDNRLVLSHSLKNDLTELANIAKTHSLTEDDSYHENYSIIRNRIKEKLVEFKQLNEIENKEVDLESLDTLINDKLIVLDGIMYSEDPFRVQTALGKVVVNLETSDIALNESSTAKETPVSGRSEVTTIKEEVDLDLLRETKEKLESLEKEEGKLLKKMKRAEKRNKSDRVEELDSLLGLRKEEAMNIHKKLVKAEEYERDKTLTINQIYKGIEDVSTEELLIEKEIKLAQLELISMDNFLSLEIAGFFDEFELIENAKIAEATQYAEQENKKTNIYVVIFSVSVAVLMVLMTYIIFQYVKKNNLYKTALKRSTNETEKLVKTRERLMTTISHEIRTPMHAISGFAEQLSKEQLSEEQEDYVSMIRKSAEHLTYLINDVLDLSKLQNGKLKLNKQPFNLRELVNDAVLFAKELVRDNRIEVTVTIDAAVADFYVGDAYRLRQILLNILGNAVKFTDAGNVNLSVTGKGTNEKVQSVKIVVEDTGIGMSEKELEKVFNEFEQFGTGTKNTISGTGLGLSITKKLIELHKGTIRISSEKDKGTIVEMILKLEISDVRKTENDRLIKQLACRSVLIVDDEEYNRKLLKAMLNGYDVQLSEAENGKEAVEKLMKTSVDLILLDARMPVMDGKETVMEIQKLEDETKKNVKVILLTAAGNGMEDLLEQVNGYVSKPFSEEKLVDEINKVFDKKTKKIEMNGEGKNENGAVDFSNLKSLSGNDVAFYTDMLNTFNTTTSNSHENIKVAFSNDDWELLANEAHKIASPCRHIGAVRLHSILKEIEQSARATGKTKQLKNKIKELDEEVSVVLKAVNEELTTIH